MTLFSSHHTTLPACVQNVPGQCDPFVLINTVPGPGLHGSPKEISPDLLLAILHCWFFLWRMPPDSLCRARTGSQALGIGQASQVSYYQALPHPLPLILLISPLTKTNTPDGVRRRLVIAWQNNLNHNDGNCLTLYILLLSQQGMMLLPVYCLRLPDESLQPHQLPSREGY